MKILFDEGVPRPLMRSLLDHQVHTVQNRGWTSIKNGALLKLIAEEAFDIFITNDKNIPAQQSMLYRPFAVIVLGTNHWPVLRRKVSAVEDAVSKAQIGALIHVECGIFKPRPAQDL